MQYIKTPSQYELVLDKLNALRPLQVAEKVKTSLSLPIANVQGNEQQNICVGAPLKCTQHGKLIVHNVESLTEYQEFNYDYASYDDILVVTFSQRVYHVVVHKKTIGITIAFYWSNPTGTKSYQDLNSVGIHNLNFVGTVLRLRVLQLAPPNLEFDVYGFY